MTNEIRRIRTKLAVMEIASSNQVFLELMNECGSMNNNKNNKHITSLKQRYTKELVELLKKEGSYVQGELM